MPYKPERLAYWYLRLNGFLQIENFIVHNDSSHLQRTDADLLAVRFRHRCELEMTDEVRLVDSDSFARVVIGEVKRGPCSLNGPWCDPSRQNVQRVLRAIGCFDETEVEAPALALYRQERYKTTLIDCQLAAFGESTNGQLGSGVCQITFEEMLAFLYRRFKAYREQKSNLAPYWPEDGQNLHDCVEGAANRKDFVAKCRRQWGLRTRRSCN